MKFAQTYMLYLIWLVPLAAALFWYGHSSRQRILKRYAKPPGLAAILPPALPRRGPRAILVLVVILLLAVALAGPQYGYRWQAVERRGVDLVIALDCSRSMLAEDIKPSRLDRAKREIVDLLKMLAGDRVGLVAFAGTAFLQCPLTVDYEAFHLFLQHLGPDFLPVGGTDLAAALTVATQSFDPETATDKAVILITDGGHTGSADLQTAVDAARKAKVKLFCIGVGGESGVPVPAAKGGFKKDRSGKIVLSRLDENGLKQMALATGGGYVRSVAGDMDLDAIYHQQIRKEMRAQTLTSSRRQVWEDRYQWALGLALALLVLEMLLPAAVRGRVARGRAAREGALALKVIPVMLLCGGLLLPQPGWAADAKKAVEAYKAGEYETALKGFIDAQLDDPDNPEVLYNVGNAYYKNGDFAAAGQQYKDALDKLGSPEENAGLAAKLHYNLGNTQFRAGQYPQSVESYQKALELTPEDTQAQENLAFVKKVMNQPPPPKKPNQGQDGDKEGDQQDKQDQQQGGQEGNQKNPAEDSNPSGGEDQSQDASGNRNQQGQSSGDQKEKQGEPSSFGKEMDANKDPNAAGTSASGPDTNQDQAASQGAGQAAEGIDPQLAEQMLNRLEDKPGRALMPAYQGREVEEDW